MNRITTQQREAIVRRAIAERDALLADCAGGSPCSTCPDKKKCEHGCVRQTEFISTEFHDKATLQRLAGQAQAAPAAVYRMWKISDWQCSRCGQPWATGHTCASPTVATGPATAPAASPGSDGAPPP